MPQDDDHEAPSPRGHLTDKQRLDLVERDARSLAQSVTMLTKKLNGIGDGFSDKQMAQLHDATAAALAEVGLRVDDADHVDDAREDFRFLRRFRQSWDSASKRVGGMVLVAGVGVLFTIIGLGFWAWINSRGGGH